LIEEFRVVINISLSLQNSLLIRQSGGSRFYIKN